MTWKWKEEVDEQKYSNDLAITNPVSPDMLTLNELRNQPPKKYVEKKEKWCNECNNAESSVRGVKKIKELVNKGFVKIVLECIMENQMKEFSTNDLKKNLCIKFPYFYDLSDGNLQRKALSYLTLIGFIKKEIIEYETKEGKTKPKFRFSLKEYPSPPDCYDKVKDCHLSIWDDTNKFRETKYFE